MKNTHLFAFLLCLGTLSIFLACGDIYTSDSHDQKNYPERIRSLTKEKALSLAKIIEQETNVELNEAFSLDLWASDSLVEDPIAISIDPQGNIYYTSATRQSNSEFDLRGHSNWTMASVSFQTIEDRRKFLRETFSETNEEGKKALKDLNEDGILDWRDLTVSKEQVWIVSDPTSDGVAQKASLYLEDFHEEITDVANGIEYTEGKVFIGAGPDLWRTEDLNDDGRADKTQSLSRGYAVHIGFSGHGMSGVIRGPDGRIYWGIGDIGANVTDQTGKQWKYPNRGVIARSELDGSGFEIFCHGVRNTHEFVFDKYGNLISEDNDGDHRGERERLVYLINGSDTGWRINWQFGKYTDPKNNSYKVWMDEKMHVPHWDGQAAYFLPTIKNYVNGPTGFVYNPGTALSPDYAEHFFVAEFRGSPSNSPIHAFTLKPKGASFELDTTFVVVKGLLPTGLDFGPEGALFFGDWIDGWATNDAGRIWKLDIPGENDSAIRISTQQAIQDNFENIDPADLASFLAHPDMRVRQKAQFELAGRGVEGKKVFDQVINNPVKLHSGADGQLARIHAIWGIGQMARLGNMDYAADLLPLLSDDDDEIKTQAAKILGDIRYADAADQIISLLASENLRLQMHAIEALGRLSYQDAFEPMIAALNKNNGDDLWLRHAGMIALARLGDGEKLVALKNHPSKNIRTTAVVALRRMDNPLVAQFLNDADEYIVAEAARAINDDFSIESAFPALANLTSRKGLKNEAALRRAINVNVRLGDEASLNRLVQYADDPSAPGAMRAEALDALRSWEHPSVYDRVDGRYRGEFHREGSNIADIVGPKLQGFLNDPSTEIKIAATKIVASINDISHSEKIFDLLNTNKDPNVKIASLATLQSLNYNRLSDALEIALSDTDKNVRAKSLELLPGSDIDAAKAISLFSKVLESGSIIEKQSVLTTLSTLKSAAAKDLVDQELAKMVAGTSTPEIYLEVSEAIDSLGDQSLKDRLVAFQKSNFENDELGTFNYALKGGNGSNGWHIFHEHEAAQCVKCHAVFELGGNAGPGLAGVADRLSPEQMLEAIILPSASYAAGYEVASIEMKNGDLIAGFVQREDENTIWIKVGHEINEVAKTDVVARNQLPSSMPPMGNILTKKEVRDLMHYLGGLKEDA